jgi:hypothetical protein
MNRALSDLFPTSDKILPTDQHKQQRSGTIHSQQYTADKKIVKQNSTEHAKVIKEQCTRDRINVN